MVSRNEIIGILAIAGIFVASRLRNAGFIDTPSNFVQSASAQSADLEVSSPMVNPNRPRILQINELIRRLTPLAQQARPRQRNQRPLTENLVRRARSGASLTSGELGILRFNALRAGPFFAVEQIKLLTRERELLRL